MDSEASRRPSLPRSSPRGPIARFWRLHDQGRSAALDICSETGELVCIASISDSGAEGLSEPAPPHSDCWIRVIATIRGELGP